MWSFYYSIQQKFVRYYSPFNINVWKKTNGDRNYLKQQKSVEFLLFRSRFSSSGDGCVVSVGFILGCMRGIRCMSSSCVGYV